MSQAKKLLEDMHAINEALKADDLKAVKEEVTSSYEAKEMAGFKTFDDFFSAVDVQNGHEDNWEKKKNYWKPYYKQVWDEYKAGKLKFVA